MITCGRCGEEIRFGARGHIVGWLHRGEVDHAAIHGQPFTPEQRAAVEAELDRVRMRETEAGEQEFYTARRYSLKDEAAAAYDEAHRADDEELIPEPEVRCHDIDPSEFAPRSGIRQIINLIDRTDGWERRRLTHSRGPYVGSAGKVLSTSDSVVLGARGPEVDAGVRVAVASWRDGKFDFAWTGILKDGIVTTNAANSDALKAWIKDTP